MEDGSILVAFGTPWDTFVRLFRSLKVGCQQLCNFLLVARREISLGCAIEQIQSGKNADGMVGSDREKGQGEKSEKNAKIVRHRRAQTINQRRAISLIAHSITVDIVYGLCKKGQRPGGLGREERNRLDMPHSQVKLPTGRAYLDQTRLGAGSKIWDKRTGLFGENAFAIWEFYEENLHQEFFGTTCYILMFYINKKKQIRKLYYFVIVLFNITLGKLYYFRVLHRQKI